MYDKAPMMHVLDRDEKKMKKIEANFDTNEKLINQIKSEFTNIREKVNQRRVALLEYQKHKQEKNYMMKEELEQAVDEAYSNYCEERVEQANLDSETKVRVVRSLAHFTEKKIPSNVGVDLLIFGLENNLAEAVRLGEDLIAVNEEQVPSHLARKVRQFTMSNSEQYKEAMKSTGPINNTKIYQKAAKATAQHSTEQHLFIPKTSAEQFYKYRFKQDRWKLPSTMRDDYLDYGGLEKVLDIEKLHKISQCMANMS